MLRKMCKTESPHVDFVPISLPVQNKTDIMLVYVIVQQSNYRRRHRHCCYFRSYITYSTRHRTAKRWRVVFMCVSCGALQYRTFPVKSFVISPAARRWWLVRLLTLHWTWPIWLWILVLQFESLLSLWMVPVRWWGIVRCTTVEAVYNTWSQWVLQRKWEKI